MAPLSMTFGHSSGLSDVAIVRAPTDGTAHLITTGADTLIVARPLDASSKTPVDASAEQEVDGGSTAKTALVASPTGDFFATATEDGVVSLFRAPAMEFECFAMRFDLPVYAVAFSADGTMLAAGGDDNCVRVVDITAENEVKHEVRDLVAPVRSLAYDPKGDYLAVSLANGTVIILDLAMDCALAATLTKVAPPADVKQLTNNSAVWTPNGAYLAVPDKVRGVNLFNRETFDQAVSFGHKAESGDKPTSGVISTLCFSPNSRFVLTAARDGELRLWDLLHIQTPVDVDRHLMADAAVALVWHAAANLVAVVDVGGEWGVWNGVVPPHVGSATAAVDAAAATTAAFTVAQDAEAEAFAGQQEVADAYGELADGNEEFDDEVMGEEEEEEEEEHTDHRHHVAYARRRGGPTGMARTALPPLPVQKAVQPGSTVSATSGAERQWLAYNMLGCAARRVEGGGSGQATVEVHFHDTSRAGARLPVMTDYYGFTMGALGEHGCAFASAGSRSTGSSRSTVLYKPFQSWAPNAEWTHQLPEGEEACGLVVAGGMVAVATSAYLLRLFTASGLQSAVVKLEGAPVALAANDTSLACVWVAGPPTPVPGGSSGSGSAAAVQNLGYAAWDLRDHDELHRGRLPLAPGATLTWLGFTEEGLLACGDSSGVVSVRVKQFGGAWTPVFDSASARSGEGETHWVVGVTASELLCVVCRESQPLPAVHPRPVLSTLPLSIPLLPAADGSHMLEEYHVRTSLMLAQGAAANVTSLDCSTEVDRNLIKLFAAACKGDKLVRALDLAKMLNFHRSMEGALKFAQRMRLPALEERVGLLIQAKAQEAELTAALGLGEPSQSQQMPSQQLPVTYVAPSLGKENNCSSQAVHDTPLSGKMGEASSFMHVGNTDDAAMDSPAVQTPEASARPAGGALAALKRKLAAGAEANGGKGTKKAAGARPTMVGGGGAANPFARK